MKEKDYEFVREKNRNPQINIEHWLQNYIYRDRYEWFFYEFPIILVEWLLRLDVLNPRDHMDGPRDYTLKWIQLINTLSNPISHAMY